MTNYAICKTFAETIMEFNRFYFYDLGLKFICNRIMCILAVKIQIDPGPYLQ